MSNTPHSSFRLDPEVKRLLAALAARAGETKTAVLERLIRAAYRSREPFPSGKKA